MATRIRAALFDKDGTLIDFTASWRGLAEDLIAAYAKGDEALADALGAAIGFDRETGLFLAGSPIVSDTTDIVADLMAALLPGVTADEIEAEANRRALAASGPAGVVPVDGLAETLDALRAMGLALGVGTHDSEAAARSQAMAMRIDGLFDFFAGYDSGHGFKPGPGMPEAFAKAVGVPPSEMVMVGDSLHDLGAGRAAGCAACVAVLTGPATEAELAAAADVVLPSVADLPDYLRRVHPA